MSTLIKKKAQTFPSSGERNFIVNNSEVILKRIEKHFSRDQIEFDYNDGLSVTAKNWRFNIRTSKTEKLLRLNIESCGNSNIIDEKLNELIALIESD
jgi:phosphomannomutase